MSAQAREAGWHVDSRWEGTAVVLTMTGELDVATAPELEHHLSQVRSSVATGLVVDCAALTFIDLAGMRALARARQHARLRGRAFCLLGVQPPMRRALAAAGLLRLCEPSPAGGPSVA